MGEMPLPARLPACPPALGSVLLPPPASCMRPATFVLPRCGARLACGCAACTHASKGCTLHMRHTCMAHLHRMDCW
jgi:hypothetical protein